MTSDAVTTRDDLPLACVPGSIPLAERPEHFRLLQHLFSTAVRERRLLPDGYAYRFDAEAFDDITRWLRNERRCCPFLAFDLELSTSAGPIWLRIRGPAATHAFLDVQFGSDDRPEPAAAPGDGR